MLVPIALCILSGPLQAIAAEAGAVMQIAPIRFGYSTSGKVDYLVRYTNAAGNQRMEQVVGLGASVGAKAETFVWQPWFLRVGADTRFTVTSQINDQSNQNSLKLARTGEMLYRTVEGGANFSVLSQSRFPFLARFSRADNRREIGIINTQTSELIDRMDLSQEYRSRRGGTRLYANYKQDRHEDQNALVSHKKYTLLEASTLISQGQTIQINSLRTSEDSEVLGYATTFDNLTARHIYRNAELSLATIATQQTSNPGTEMLQYSTVGTWRPVNSRLTVVGGVRLYDNIGLSGVKSGYTGANVGANYAVNNWFRLYGSVNVYDSNGVQSVSSSTITNLSAAAQHHFETLKLKDLNYNRFVSANVSNNSRLATDSNTNTTSAGNSQTASVRLQHGLQGSNVFFTGGTGSASQELYALTSSASEPLMQLRHSAIFIRRISRFRVSLSGRDTRDLTGTKSFLQSLALQGSQGQAVSSTSSIAGNITVRALRTGYDVGPSQINESLTSTATLQYQNSRAFGVRNMIFTSYLRAISADLLNNSSELSQSMSNQGQYTWDNKLTYTVGKLRLEWQGTVEEIRSANIVRLSFHARRNF